MYNGILKEKLDTVKLGMGRSSVLQRQKKSIKNVKGVTWEKSTKGTHMHTYPCLDTIRGPNYQDLPFTLRKTDWGNYIDTFSGK